VKGGRPVHSCPGLHRGDAPEVPDRLLACPPCWYALPRPLQRAVLRHRVGTDEHFQAMAAAVEWWRAERARRAEQESNA
jgi:hypothetical protein